MDGGADSGADSGRTEGAAVSRTPEGQQLERWGHGHRAAREAVSSAWPAVSVDRKCILKQH